MITQKYAFVGTQKMTRKCTVEIVRSGEWNATPNNEMETTHWEGEFVHFSHAFEMELETPNRQKPVLTSVFATPEQWLGIAFILHRGKSKGN